ncbi:MAG: glycosyltransferase family 4 protein [Planctomycetota bacterium]
MVLERPLRVALCEPAGRGGICHYTYALAGALGAAGADLLLLTSVDYELAERPASFAIARVFNRYLTHPIRVLRPLHRFRPDIVHLQTATHPALHLALLGMARVGTRAATIVTAHNVLPKASGRIAALASGMLYRRTHRVICHAPVLADEISQRFRLARSKLAVIPHGDSSHLVEGTVPSAPPNGTPPTMLFFGYLHEEKGLEDLIEALPYVRAAVPESRLVVAGTPEMPIVPLQAQACERGVAAFIDWRLRYVDSREMHELFAGTHLVVLPYRRASQSGVALLAGAFSRPVVATRTGGLSEVIVHGETGLLVEPHHPRELAEALVEVLKAPERARHLGRTHHERCRGEFSWVRVAAETVRVYEVALCDGSPAREGAR